MTQRSLTIAGAVLLFTLAILLRAGHARHGNVADVHFLALDEVEQQVHRPAEGVEIDLVFMRSRCSHGSVIQPLDARV
jgi:hypothetical protein